MFCERCRQRPAVVHFTEIVNDQKKQMSLCEPCLREVHAESFGSVPQLNLHHFLAGLLNNDAASINVMETNQQSRECQKCGLSEAQFAQLGFLGCGDCYTHFEDRMVPLVKRIHGHKEHIGKIPQRSGSKARLVKKINGLRDSLRDAVAKEEFEKAAELRDVIRDLEQEIGREG